jgi:RND superfamily putative drug exporter
VTVSTESLARACARHPWRTLAAWLVVLVLAIAAIVTLLELSDDGGSTGETESSRAYDLLVEHFPPDPDFASEIVIVRSDSLTLDDQAFPDLVRRLAADIRAAGARSVRTFDDDATFISGDRRATVIRVGLGDGGDAEVERLVQLVEEADGGPFDVTVTGERIADRDIDVILQEDLRTGELYFGLPASLIILLIVFGTLVAAFVPLVLALVAITVAMGLSALVGLQVELSVFLANMVSVMGLAIGIDYSLFVVSRFREERAAGREPLDAIAATGATASRAVLFSGLAFVLAMGGLLIVPDTIIQSLALGAVLVGVSAVAAALTLLPAILRLVGDRLEALRVPYIGGLGSSEGRFWGTIARSVTGRPVIGVAAASVLLLFAAAPILAIDIGTSGIRTLPDEMLSKQGFLALDAAFDVGTLDTVQVVVPADVDDDAVRDATEQLVDDLDSNPVFHDVEARVSPDGEVLAVEAFIAGDSRDVQAVEAVEELRAKTAPAAFAGVAPEVLVTGETMEEIEYVELVREWLPRVFAFVLGLSLVLLTVAFRSIVVPVKAVLLNLLSVGAAYGVLVLVFQEGVGAGLLGLQRTEQITPWLPLFLFAILFGLSMDYHVFLLSRIRERWEQTGDSTEAVVQGVTSTARVITGAALIVIFVFAGFASGRLVETQQIGFGIAVALLIDATIVRSVLVPASMTLLGRWNWYLPSWLEWLPDLHVESSRREG